MASSSNRPGSTPTDHDANSSDAPLVGGAAADDPFAQVPDSPNFHEATPGESTSAIIRKSGATEKGYGKLAAGFAIVAVLLGGAAYAGLRYSGVIQIEPVQARDEMSDVDWSKLNDDPSLKEKLSGEQRRKADEAARAEAARRARAAREDDLLMPQDEDRRGAIVKAPRKEQVVASLTPEQMALLLAAQADQKPKGAQPSVNNLRAGGDDDLEVNRKGGAGGLDEKAVSDRITKAKPGMDNCISTALHRTPDLRLGKVVITATIGASGVVTKALFNKPRVGESDLGECLRKVVKSIVFPPFEGEATDVEIPLTIGASE